MKKITARTLFVLLFIRWLSLIFAELPDLPAGTDWSQYIMGAEVIWNFDVSLHYPSWRKPFYSYLLGLFAAESYVQSGRILASIGMLCSLIAFATWFSGKSRIVGLGLMLAFSFHPLVLDGINYMNPYPLMGGLVTLGLVLSLKKDIGKFGLLMAGATVAFAIALDGRAWVSVLFISIFFLWKRYPVQKWFAWFLGMLPIFWVNFWLINSFGLELLSLTDQLWEQRAFLFREDMEFQLYPFHRNNGLVAGYCVGEAQYISAEWFFSDCMSWLSSTNWSAIQRIGILPSWEILGGLFLLTIWRARAHSFWGILGASLGFSLLLWAPPRYYFLSMGALFVLFGEACLLLSKKNWIQLGLGAGIIWFWYNQAAPFSSKDYPREWKGIVPKLVSNVGEDQLLDCSGKDLWLVHSSSRRSSKRSLFLKGNQCISVLEQERFNFVLLPENKQDLLSREIWVQQEIFEIQNKEILLFKNVGF